MGAKFPGLTSFNFLLSPNVLVLFEAAAWLEVQDFLSFSTSPILYCQLYIFFRKDKVTCYLGLRDLISHEILIVLLFDGFNNLVCVRITLEIAQFHFVVVKFSRRRNQVLHNYNIY